ncbi:MAG: hypothetical protein ACAI44_12135 [Candidatus Sericytochromatia bacterium]
MDLFVLDAELVLRRINFDLDAFIKAVPSFPPLSLERSDAFITSKFQVPVWNSGKLSQMDFALHLETGILMLVQGKQGPLVVEPSPEAELIQLSMLRQTFERWQQLRPLQAPSGAGSTLFGQLEQKLMAQAA